MLQFILFSGPIFPFLLLLLIAVVSGFCAHIIASEDAPGAPRSSSAGSIRSIRLPAKMCQQRHAQTERCSAFIQQPAQNDYMKQFAEKNTLSDFKIPKSSKRDRRPTGGRTERFQTFAEKPVVANHYACPPTSLEELRKRYGTGNFWGDWSNRQTRQFYRQQLPRSLQIDGALGLSLEERAQLAAQARHALRIYSRERCHLPGRLIARLYDGLRHLHMFGYWSSDGMSWQEVKEKYAREGRRELGEDASEESVALFVYRRIVDRACASNALFDEVARSGDNQQFMSILKSIYNDGPAKPLTKSTSDTHIHPLNQLEKLTNDFEYETELVEQRIRSGVKELESEVKKVVGTVAMFLHNEKAAHILDEHEDLIAESMASELLESNDELQHEDELIVKQTLISESLDECLEGCDFDISDSITESTHVCGSLEDPTADYDYCPLDDTLAGAFATMSDTVSEGMASDAGEPLLGNPVIDESAGKGERIRKRDIFKSWFRNLRPNASPC